MRQIERVEKVCVCVSRTTCVRESRTEKIKVSEKNEVRKSRTKWERIGKSERE